MDKKIAIMQPYFLPYIGYFQLINAVDKFVIYDDVNYINRGWVNRNQILVNGSSSYITVPLKEASQNKCINEILLSKESKWQEKMLRTVELAYKRAPFFEEIYGLFKQILSSEFETIHQFNVIAIKAICSYVNIQTTIQDSSTVYGNRHLSGQDRILDICTKESANYYINPIGGVSLYDSKFFNDSDVQINFLQSKPITYKQFGDEFTPWLSILDVLMFNDKETIMIFLNNFSLV
jgi:hypothetical protein